MYGTQTKVRQRYPCLLYTSKMVYDWAILSDILAGHNSISEAKVEVYEKHKKDLALLKKTVKTYFTKEMYQEVFVETKDKLNNYPAYIGMTKKNGKKIDLAGKHCSREEFLDFLKKNVVAKLPDEELKTVLMEEIAVSYTHLINKQSNESRSMSGFIPKMIVLRLKKLETVFTEKERSIRNGYFSIRRSRLYRFSYRV